MSEDYINKNSELNDTGNGKEIKIRLGVRIFRKQTKKIEDT